MTAPETQTPGGNRASAENKTKLIDITRFTKELSTLNARAARAGVTLHVIEDDHGKTAYIVSRWAMTRELRSVDELKMWLDFVTGGKS